MANQNQTAYGSSQPLINVFPEPVKAQRAPTVNDKDQIGRLWVDEVNNHAYTLTSITNNQANWTTNTTSGTGTFAAVEATAGDVTVDVGNVVVTLGNITAGGGISSTGSYTSVSGNIAALAGDVRAENNLVATSGNITADAGNITATLGDVTAGQAVTAGTTITAAGDITSTVGSIVTSVGNADIGGFVVAVGNISSTAGNITTAAGNIVSATDVIAVNNISTINGNINSANNINVAVDLNVTGNIVSVTGSILAQAGEIGAAGYSMGDLGAFKMVGNTFMHAGNFPLGYNTYLGLLAGSTVLGQGGFNVGIGGKALGALTAGNFENVGVGYFSLGSITTALNNTAIGSNSFADLTNGSFNIGLGYESGINCVGFESSNIYIGHAGVAAESNTIRLGTDGGAPGQQHKCYIAGDVYAARSLNSTDGTFANSVTVGTANILSGAGDPNGTVTATQGSLYLNLTGSGVADRAWINVNGGTIWTNLVTAA